MSYPKQKFFTGFILHSEHVRRIASAIASNVGDNSQAHSIVQSAAKLEGYNIVSANFPLPGCTAHKIFIFCICNTHEQYVTAKMVSERLPRALNWLEAYGLPEVEQMPLFTAFCDDQEENHEEKLKLNGPCCEHAV